MAEFDVAGSVFKVFSIRAHQTARVYGPKAWCCYQDQAAPLLRSYVPSLLLFQHLGCAEGDLVQQDWERKKEIWTTAIPALIFSTISELLEETHEWQTANQLLLLTFHNTSLSLSLRLSCQHIDSNSTDVQSAVIIYIFDKNVIFRCFY